jgi:hypothetical protein
LEVDNVAGDGEYSLEQGQRIAKVKQNVEGNDDLKKTVESKAKRV